jgi:ubiquinone/menaquinone biosynthesis C-methylase UbiE
MERSGKQQWEANAAAFAGLISDQGTPHHRNILNPCVEQLMGDVSGRRILDAGCGEGYLARQYARKGATIRGIDFSDHLLTLAKEKTPQGLDITYENGDICDLNKIPDTSFDIVLCNLVLLNTPCLDAALNEFNRVLVEKGVLVFSVVHPAFNFYGPGSWEMGEKDPVTNRRQGKFFKVDDYFDEKEFQHYWRTREGEEFPSPISFYHRTLSTYYQALSAAGFTTTHIEEPRPPPEDDFFERERRIPFFLVVRAAKTGGHGKPVDSDSQDRRT